jgi:signal transduction histidine kinase
MTIQKRLWISNLILVFITIVLLIGVSLIITENFQNFIGLPSPDNHMSPLNRALYRAERTLIKVIETEPERYLEQDYLQQIDDFFNSLNIGLIVQKENEFVYFSSFVTSKGFEREDISLNNYQIEPKSDNLTHISDNLFMKAIPFHFNDQSQGEIFLVYDSTSAAQELNQFKNSVIYTLILFLIIIISINTLITYFLSKQIVNPLIHLKNAAKQIRKGNYDFSLKSPSRDEIGDLFQSFEAARKQLKESEETKIKYEKNRNELITNISHDLKTPITTIKGYVEGIMDGVPKSKEKQDKYLQTIHQNAMHMESLIEDLFLLSKFDLDQSIYQFENINIKDFLADSYEELRFDLEEKGITLEFEANYIELNHVKADRQQLKRVILNIINNAIDFKKDNNSVIKLILTETENEAKIEIYDNGKGVSKETLDKIFDRFYKADKSRSNKTPGTGLGLHIARKIIADHGGRIWAQSKTGSGTSIFFTLKKVKQNSEN